MQQIAGFYYQFEYRFDKNTIYRILNLTFYDKKLVKQVTVFKKSISFKDTKTLYVGNHSIIYAI